MSPRAAKIVSFAAAATVTSVFFINFCASIFQCGCVSLWSGADGRCNVHMHGVRHCPWCTYGLTASMIPYLIIVAAQAAISFWPRPISVGVRVLAASLAFPAVGALLAAIYGLASGYWK